MDLLNRFQRSLGRLQKESEGFQTTQSTLKRFSRSRLIDPLSSLHKSEQNGEIGIKKDVEGFYRCFILYYKDFKCSDKKRSITFHPDTVSVFNGLSKGF